MPIERAVRGGAVVPSGSQSKGHSHFSEFMQLSLYAKHPPPQKKNCSVLNFSN